MSRKSIFLALSLLALAALALAACTPTEVVKTVIVTQEVVTEGETVIQEVVVTATPEPEAPVEAEPRTLVVCLGQEPDMLFAYGTNMLAASQVQNALYDGPYEANSFAYQPVINEKLPSLSDGDAVIQPVAVAEGDSVVDNTGEPATLTAKTAEAAGTLVRPAGCRATDCAVEYDGTNVTEMDQMVVTFKLLPNLLWSDGTPVTAADQVYSFELNGSPDIPAPTRYNFDRTASYEATDDLTTVWTGLPGFMNSDYMITMWTPQPKHVMEQYAPADLLTMVDDPANGLLLSYGPYAIDTWEKGVQITMHKNPNYFRASEGLPKFDNLVYRFIGADANADIAAILAGECDVVTQDASLDSQSELLLQLQAKGQINPTFVTGTVYEHTDFNIHPVESIVNTGVFAGWDQDGNGEGPFGDVRLRQAILMCMDRQAVVDTVTFGQSMVINTYLPPNHPLYNPDVKTYAYDPVAAAALLDEAGWVDDDADPATPRVAKGALGVPDGTKLSMNYQTTTAAYRAQVTQILQQSLADCGIEVNLGYMPASQWFENSESGPLYGRLFDLGEFAWLTGVTPPCDLYITSEMPGENNGWAGSNMTGLNNAEFDAACAMQKQSLPGEESLTTGALEAQRLWAELVPSAPLFLRLKLAATRPDMCNFIMDPTNNSEMWNLENFDYGDGCSQ